MIKNTAMQNIITTVCFCLLFVHLGYSIDKGIGVVTLKNKKNQQLNVYMKMSTKSRVIAKYSIDGSKGWFDYSISGKEVETSNLLEYGYEEFGLPICKVKSYEWVQVMYGYDKDGEMLFGWVKSEEGKTEILLWDSFLKDQLIFFEDPNQVKFYDSIDGDLIDFKLEPSEHLTYDYIMKPMTVEGDWMKVKVVTPNDYCNDPSNVRNIIVWIKFLSNNGRPLVWYFTRGC